MRIVSWNAYGAPEATLRTLGLALLSENIDVCVLQETHAENDHWYDPLRNIRGYALVPAIAENQSIALPTGGEIHPPQTVRGYAVLYREATAPPSARPTLLNYTRDAYWGPLTPCSAFEAEKKGYNQRPALAVPVTYNREPAFIYTWHAPQDIWNGVALNMFSRSAFLKRASANHTVIAGDLNTKSVSGIFNGFAGLQQKDSKIDYILANTQLGSVNEIPGLNVSFGTHWAVAAEVSW